MRNELNFNNKPQILKYFHYCPADKYLVPISWPQNGKIIFDNVSLQHKSRSLANGPVLIDLSLTIPAGQKVSS